MTYYTKQIAHKHSLQAHIIKEGNHKYTGQRRGRLIKE